MRKAIAVALLLAGAIPLALAQVALPGPGTGGMSGDRVETTAPRAVARASNRYADARHCLEFETNRQVIVCAEKYLPTLAASH